MHGKMELCISEPDLLPADLFGSRGHKAVEWEFNIGQTGFGSWFLYLLAG